MKKHHNGFVALFFVLTIASFLTVLVYNVTRNFEYTLILLKNFRVNDMARSSALYCKYKLYNNLLSNISYAPELATDIPSPYGSVCMYYSYKKIGLDRFEVIIIGKYTSKSFALKYVYEVTSALRGYIREINLVEI